MTNAATYKGWEEAAVVKRLGLINQLAHEITRDFPFFLKYDRETRPQAMSICPSIVCPAKGPPRSDQE